MPLRHRFPGAESAGDIPYGGAQQLPGPKTFGETPGDVALIQRVAAGEEAALRTLYERHAAGMLRLIRRLTARRDVAEEILQESWLAVWRSAGGYRGEAPVRTWLLGVARRQAHNRLRRAEPVLVELDHAVDVPDAEPAVEEQVLARAERRELVAAVVGLPARSPAQGARGGFSVSPGGRDTRGPGRYGQEPDVDGPATSHGDPDESGQSRRRGGRGAVLG